MACGWDLPEEVCGRLSQIGARELSHYYIKFIYFPISTTLKYRDIT